MYMDEVKFSCSWLAVYWVAQVKSCLGFKQHRKMQKSKAYLRIPRLNESVITHAYLYAFECCIFPNQ